MASLFSFFKKPITPIIPITIVTHNGTFHTDDVFACAILSLYFKQVENKPFRIVRSRDESAIAAADVVVDVGGVYDSEKKRFDHHQKGGAGVRDSGIPYASAGLVWRHYGDAFCGGDSFMLSKIDRKIFCGIDAIDNGVDFTKPIFEYIYSYDISMFFGSMKPTWKHESPQAMDVAFFSAIAEAEKLLTRELAAERDAKEALEIIRGSFEKAARSESDLVELPYNFGSSLINRVSDQYPKVLYTIAPRASRGWELVCTRVPGSFENKKPLPVSWRGLRDTGLQQETGVPDAFFCHNSGYMILADSKEGILALVEQAQNQYL